MKTSINLVSKRRTPNAFHKRFFTGAVVIFSLAFLISAGLIVYRLYLAGELSNFKEEEARLTSVINSNPEKKIKYLSVRERLAEIQKVISKRKNINSRLVSVSQTLPLDVGISLIEGDEEKVVLQVVASDLSSLNTLIETKIEEYATESQKTVKRVEMSSFGLDTETNQYKANFTIEFI